MLQWIFNEKFNIVLNRFTLLFNSFLTFFSSPFVKTNSPISKYRVGHFCGEKCLALRNVLENFLLEMNCYNDLLSANPLKFVRLLVFYEVFVAFVRYCSVFSFCVEKNLRTNHSKSKSKRSCYYKLAAVVGRNT